MDINAILPIKNSSNFISQPNKEEITSNNPFLFSDFLDYEAVINVPELQKNIPLVDNELYNIISSNLGNIEFDESSEVELELNEQTIAGNEQNIILFQTQSYIIPHYTPLYNEQIVENDLTDKLEFSENKASTQSDFTQLLDESEQEISENLKLESDEEFENHISKPDKEKNFSFSKDSYKEESNSEHKQNPDQHKSENLQQKSNVVNKPEALFQDNIVKNKDISNYQPSIINPKPSIVNSKPVKLVTDEAKIKISSNLNHIIEDTDTQDLSTNSFQNDFIKNLNQDLNLNVNLLNIDQDTNLLGQEISLPKPEKLEVTDSSTSIENNTEPTEFQENIQIDSNQSSNVTKVSEFEKNLSVPKPTNIEKHNTNNFNVPEQIQVNISQALKVGQNEITIKLKPIELGSIDVKIESNNGRTYISIIAEKQDTLSLLQQDVKLLESNLNEIGIKIDPSQLSFSLNQNNQNNSQNQRAMQELLQEFHNVNPNEILKEEDEVNIKTPYSSAFSNNNDKLDIKI
ncbi:MAG: flagellar hook-length control protein FliK [Alphaproteobacteria bacterium]